MLKFNASSLGNIFLLFLFGSVFVQPRPSFFAMAIGLALMLAVFFLGRSKYPLSFASLKQSYLIWAVLIAWPVAHILIAVLHEPIAWGQLGNPLRSFIALGVLVFLACVRTNINALFAGIAIACAAAFAHAAYDKFFRHLPRALAWFNNEIHFGDYSSLVGIFALIIAFMGYKLSTGSRVALFVLGLLAYFAAAASGTRTAAFTIVCLLPLFWMRHSDAVSRRLRLVLCIAAAIAIVFIAFSERARESIRINEGIADVKSILAGGSRTSIGDRQQMWIAAVDMARSSPLIGIGLNNFQHELESRIASKKVLPLGDKQNQAHSQILHSLATGGLALLAIYLFFVVSPMVWFIRVYRSVRSNSETRLIAYLGLTNIVCHVIFGLTAAIFDIQVFSSLYVLSLAAFSALCISVQSGHPAVKHADVANHG